MVTPLVDSPDELLRLSAVAPQMHAKPPCDCALPDEPEGGDTLTVNETYWIACCGKCGRWTKHEGTVPLGIVQTWAG